MIGPVRSLSKRLVVAALIWLVLLLALGGWGLAWAFRDTLAREFGRRLDALVLTAIAAIEVKPDGSVTLDRSLGDPRFEQIYSGWYWQISTPGGGLLRSRSLWDQSLETAPGHEGGVLRRAMGPQGERLLVAERDVELPESAGTVHVLVAADPAEVADGVHRFNLLLIASLGTLGLGMAVAVRIQVRFGLRPLRTMMEDLEAVHRGQRPRLNGAYPHEVAPLAEAMNEVLDHDAELIERARTHVGNLAHGLKTPLAVILAEMAAEPDRKVVAAQLAIIRRLIEHHLGRASAEAGAGRMGQKQAVAPVVSDLAAAMRKVFADRALDIAIAVDADATFLGQNEDLAEMIGNLMENACKWARSQVRVSAGSNGGGLVVTVEDDGPGMTPEQAREAAGRGKRLDEMTAGWGLGLSIVADLVAVNGGTMDFEAAPLGGLLVRLRLP